MTWKQIVLWFNKHFRPLKITVNQNIVLIKIQDIVVDESIDYHEATQLVISAMAKNISINKKLRNVPIVINVDRKLLSGKYRLAALQKLGWQYVPCKVV